MYSYVKKQPASKAVNPSKKQDKPTGIPIHMKNYIETQTGLSYDDVRVHYNAAQPARWKALGYTQGTHVYLKQGQEKHLMHELCHVAQQKKGIVKPTAVMDQYGVNDSIPLEREADLCEKQYEREAPVQMLREATSKASDTMGMKGLGEGSHRYHTLGYFRLQDTADDAVWSHKAHWMPAGGGDHAEDAICDQMEIFGWGGVNLQGKRLDIFLDKSPCERCQQRLNDLGREYGLEVHVTCAAEYKGTKGGGAGDDAQREYEQTVLEGTAAEKLVQF